MNSFPPEELYYITVVDNLQSILKGEILSHKFVAQLESLEKLEYTSIADEKVVSRRKDKSTPAKLSLWHYANLYFQPRNPMMYKAVETGGGGRNIPLECFVVIGVSNAVLRERGVLIADGNAASNSTQFYGMSDGMAKLREQWHIIQSKWWRENPDDKRKIMAECLVPNQVKPYLFCSLYVVNSVAERHMKQIVGIRSISVVPNARMFFR